MQRSARLYLAEIQDTAEYLLQIAETSTFTHYLQERTQRLAVERCFILIGEALAQLGRFYPELLRAIATPRQVISFRNVIVHRYWSIDDEEVWSILVTEVSPLHRQVTALLMNLDSE